MTFYLYSPGPIAIDEESVLLSIEPWSPGPPSKGDVLFVYSRFCVDRIYTITTTFKSKYFISIQILEFPLPRMAIIQNSDLEGSVNVIESPNRNGTIARAIPNKSGEWLKQLCIGPAQALLEGDSQAPSETETLQLKMERITQGIFRNSLLAFWEGACCVSGITDHRFLRASHIKPWAEASDRERMDPRNGLLLAVNYDFAFDQGFITFNQDGGMVVHPSVDPGNLYKIGVTTDAMINKALDLVQGGYMAYHREKFFREG